MTGFQQGVFTGDGSAPTEPAACGFVNVHDIAEHGEGHHVLVARSGEQMFLAMLQNKDDNHNPQVAIAETPRGQPVDFSNPDFLKDPPPK